MQAGRAGQSLDHLRRAWRRAMLLRYDGTRHAEQIISLPSQPLLPSPRPTPGLPHFCPHTPPAGLCEARPLRRGPALGCAPQPRLPPLPLPRAVRLGAAARIGRRIVAPACEVGGHAAHQAATPRAAGGVAARDRALAGGAYHGVSASKAARQIASGAVGACAVTQLAPVSSSI